MRTTADVTTQAQSGADEAEGIDPVADLDEATALDSNAAEDGEGARAGSARWRRVVAYVLLPGLAMVLAVGAGYLKWVDSSTIDSDRARAESVEVATEGTIAMLTYQPGTVEEQLTAARDRLIGPLKDSYGSLINEVVIPGAKDEQISAATKVPAAATVSASQDHAVVLVFVDQTVTVGSAPATSSASRVRVRLDKVGGRWLIAGFDPI